MLCYFSSKHLQEPLGVFCKIEHANFNSEQEKESIICVKNFPQEYCLLSLGKPRDVNSDPRDNLFYHTLTLMKDSYITSSPFLWIWKVF